MTTTKTTKLLRVIPKTDCLERRNPNDLSFEDLVLKLVRPKIQQAIDLTRPKNRILEERTDSAVVSMFFFSWHSSRQEPKLIRFELACPEQRHTFSGIHEMRTAAMEQSEPAPIAVYPFSLDERIETSLAFIRTALPGLLDTMREKSRLNVKIDWAVELALEYRLGSLFASKITESIQNEDWEGFSGKKVR